MTMMMYLVLALNTGTLVTTILTLAGLTELTGVIRLLIGPGLIT